MTTQITSVATDSKSGLRGIADLVQAEFDEDTAAITGIVTTGVLDQKTVEKKFVKEAKKAQKALDVSLKDIETGSKDVVKVFKTATKIAVNDALPAALDAYNTVVEIQVLVLENLFGDDKNAQKVIK